MGKLHRHSKRYALPERFTAPMWDEVSLAKAFEQLRAYTSVLYTPDEFAVLEQAADKTARKIAGLPRTSDSFGLIHSDFHDDNYLFDGDEARIIDFSRFGFGFYMHDIAQMTFGLHIEQRISFVEGYRAVCPIADMAAAVKEIETFFVMCCLENVSFHAPNPKETENILNQKGYMLQLFNRYLNDEPFVFTRI